MSILEITGLFHTFGDNRVFHDADFVLHKGEHVGVVGPNGIGKSTLIKICSGQIIPDAGRIDWMPRITMGYLDQYAELDGNAAIRDFLRSAFTDLYGLEEEMLRLYAESDGSSDNLEKAAAIQEALELREFYSIDTSIEQIASGLGLHAVGLQRPITELSGGQRAKVILAKLLLVKPDVMLLDEPTNFLDSEHIIWLSEYLTEQNTAYMVVSHDNEFLEKITTCICDVGSGKLKKYYGSYLEFQKKKEFFREDYIRKYTAQQKEIKKTEEFIRRNIAGIKTKMARGRRTRLMRMEKLEALDQVEIKPLFQFLEKPLTDTEHLLVRDLCIGYQQPLLPALNFSVNGGRRVVVTGFNGIGKSTLLKTLIGQIPALSGSFQFSEQVIYGYYEQDLVWENDRLTPIDIVSEEKPTLTQKEIRQHLSRCGISRKHALQHIGTLSGGEQAKVKMSLLMLRPCNFLILDEPTNHMDQQAKEALQKAVLAFSGTVLLVSHEDAFYREWADQIIDFENCSL